MSATQTEPTPAAHVASGGVHRLLALFSASEPEVGYSRALTSEGLVIGRDPSGQPGLALPEAQVSRTHARIELLPEGGFALRDQGSRNGTFVNGRRVASATLADGDVVRIGGTLLLFQVLDMQACQRVLDPAPPLEGLVGGGHAMGRVRSAVRAAPPSGPILIVGETGVGKELVAQALHRHGARSGPFVPVNCSALPSNLIESELFGHVRGAFTGAEARKGLFGRAEHGTLFLDEIGEIGVEVQAKLLRAVALGEVRAVGSDHPRTADVCIVAATNADLEQAVAQGRFRGDLYARLMTYIIEVPPLRARKEDILELARHFLGGGDFELTADSAEAVLTYGWPYNVRELEQILTPLAGRVAQTGVLELADLPARVRTQLDGRPQPAPAPDPAALAMVGIRRDAVPSADELRAVMKACQGNVAQVASFFRKDRRQIYRWAEASGVDIRGMREALEGGAHGTQPPPAAGAPADEEEER